MCELLGLCFNKNVRATFSFRGFIPRGDHNPDGWGLAFYPQNGFAAQVIKEPQKATKSQLANFLKEYREVSSPIYISHVRFATSETSYANTHPFTREYKGREYIFAHNGVLNGNYKSSLSLGRWTPIGTTDSEFAFCHIMNVMEAKVRNWDNQSLTLLQDTMRAINHHGSFNCLLSDGERLFCYRDIHGYRGLCYAQRQANFGNVKLVDEDVEVNLSLSKMPNEKGYIIATRKITNEEWIDFEKGSLTVFSQGEIIYPKLTQEQIVLALNCIRNSPHRVSVFDICNATGAKIWNAKTMIEDLKKMGYIRQDSRDTVAPYDPSATYFTDPDNRAEIDSLLATDKNTTNESILKLKIIQP